MSIEAINELDNIHFKYERLQSTIWLLQKLLESGGVEVVDAPKDSLTNALFEIALEMGEANERLGNLLTTRGGTE